MWLFRKKWDKRYSRNMIVYYMRSIQCEMHRRMIDRYIRLHNLIIIKHGYFPINQLLITASFTCSKSDSYRNWTILCTPWLIVIQSTQNIHAHEDQYSSNSIKRILILRNDPYIHFSQQLYNKLPPKKSWFHS
jgi:hypothetical protein